MPGQFRNRDTDGQPMDVRGRAHPDDVMSNIDVAHQLMADAMHLCREAAGRHHGVPRDLESPTLGVVALHQRCPTPRTSAPCGRN
jgi:hypothetical protein